MKILKKATCLVLTAFFAVGAFLPYETGAATVAELEAKRKNLAQQTANARKEIENLKSKQLSVEEEINAMDKVMNSLQAELDAAETDLDVLTASLRAAEKELEDASAKREKQFELLGSRLRFLQQKGSTGYLEILLESESFSDLFLRMQYVNDIMLFDKDILDELQAIQDTIKAKTEEIAENHEAQIEVVALQKEKVESMKSLISEKETLMASYANDAKKQEQLIAANAKADQKILNLIAQQSGSATPYYTGNGSLGWPVPAKKVASSSLSSGYVRRRNPVTGRNESHSGYDIPAPYGSAIVAAEAGKITYSGWMNGYGYTIIIDHGGGLTTLYGHNSSLTVSKGQMVTRGQTVAKCGSTGISTGNHCHFSVLVNGKYVNPESYLGVRNVGY
ncbi:murein hydrolase activator EnvC family protein [Anaerotignum sp. MB30-C6]|uniref:murein hydrolase activator EnvC family protein n=1 Tax=Anaerotignum sp. MB30-C6 TaxID=3070814 RepID=UPI0027DBD86F|nr:peptidoglycan DD-metalloendopeptidase family protein [Anaerotignum sp. MB30-C6]WMI79852.1 peptidoglycan DD-metalloendopeptidase family protein [Anaerotignum sp. MB30-C6]